MLSAIDAQGLPGPADQDPKTLIDRAEQTIESARAALEASRKRMEAKAPTSLDFLKPETPPIAPPFDEEARQSPGQREARPPKAPYGTRGAPAGSTGSLQGPPSPGSRGRTRELAKDPMLKRQRQSEQVELAFMEMSSDFLEFRSQGQEDMAAFLKAELPPLQSVVELTSSFQPPQRGQKVEVAGQTVAAMAMADGEGQLADGTKWEKMSGEETGEGGYWKRWTVIKGSSGKVEWEEKWWEASDWSGMRETGAEKSGCASDGSAWREHWLEKLVTLDVGEPQIERTAHKWCRMGDGKVEWEEQWGEMYQALGRTVKHAHKWAKEEGGDWHERWGEEYDGRGWCRKYTDKWAERTLEGGGREQWGDKWEEDFGSGKGGKKGETWSIGSDGARYNKWWGEDHFGDGRVRKHGNSTGGEYWDVVEHMDTYYNPTPHFGFHHAWHHSPQLRNVPERPRDTRENAIDELGPGLGAL